jgi:hypothetical protein
MFMEVNGRFWGSLPLAVHAGAPFAWYTYSVLGLRRVPEARPYRVGLRCRCMLPEYRRLFTVLFRRSAIQDRQLRLNPLAELASVLAGFFDPRQRYFVLSLDDPLPMLRDLRAVLAKPFRLLAQRLTWRSAQSAAPLVRGTRQACCQRRDRPRTIAGRRE